MEAHNEPHFTLPRRQSGEVKGKALQKTLLQHTDPLEGATAAAAGHYALTDDVRALEKHNCILTTLSDKHSLQTFGSVNWNFT